MTDTEKDKSKSKMATLLDEIKQKRAGAKIMKQIDKDYDDHMKVRNAKYEKDVKDKYGFEVSIAKMSMGEFEKLAKFQKRESDRTVNRLKIERVEIQQNIKEVGKGDKARIEERKKEGEYKLATINRTDLDSGKIKKKSVITKEENIIKKDTADSIKALISKQKSENIVKKSTLNKDLDENSGKTRDEQKQSMERSMVEKKRTDDEENPKRSAVGEGFLYIGKMFEPLTEAVQKNAGLVTNGFNGVMDDISPLLGNITRGIIKMGKTLMKKGFDLMLKGILSMGPTGLAITAGIAGLTVAIYSVFDTLNKNLDKKEEKDNAKNVLESSSGHSLDSARLFNKNALLNKKDSGLTPEGRADLESERDINKKLVDEKMKLVESIQQQKSDLAEGYTSGVGEFDVHEDYMGKEKEEREKKIRESEEKLKTLSNIKVEENHKVEFYNNRGKEKVRNKNTQKAKIQRVANENDYSTGWDFLKSKSEIKERDWESAKSQYLQDDFDKKVKAIPTRSTPKPPIKGIQTKDIEKVVSGKGDKAKQQKIEAEEKKAERDAKRLASANQSQAPAQSSPIDMGPLVAGVNKLNDTMTDVKYNTAISEGAP